MNPYFTNSQDLLPNTRARAGDVEANFDQVEDGFDGVKADMDLKAPLASPALSGVPTAPTAPAGTNTTQIATTAYVFAERTNPATLTNKTLSTPVINTISNGGFLTLPSATDVLVGRATTDTLTNKTLTSPIINSPTGLVKADVGLGNVDNTSDLDKPISTAAQTALNGKQDLDSDLTALAGVVSSGFLVRTGAGTAAARTLVQGAGVTITNADGIAGDPVISLTPGSGTGDVTGPTGAVSNNIVTFGDATGKLLKDGGKALPSGAIVGVSDTQTLTNKTLTSPVIAQNVQVINTNTTAVASRIYVLTATLTLGLPSSPAPGDWVTAINRSGTTTPVIARNGQNIMGLAEDLTLDSANAPVTLIFADATRGWVFS